MIINAATLNTIFTAFSAAYQAGLSGVSPVWETIATPVPSTTRTNEYGWLGSWPKLREWIGDREVNNIAQYGYSIKNRTFEGSVSVPAEDIEDDQLGIYTPMVTEMGRSVGTHPDELVFEALKNGWGANGYDGVPFFGSHKVGKKVVANFKNGAEPAWYLMDCSRALKPMIYQKRRDYRLIRKDDPTKSDAVFTQNKFVYGVDGRSNVGYGFWQMAYGSKEALTRDNLRAAFTAMGQQEDDKGKKIAVRATHLLVPSTLEFTARDLILSSVAAAGATNTDYNLVKVMASSYLD